jgi:intracellular multiplication protein IcmP
MAAGGGNQNNSDSSTPIVVLVGLGLLFAVLYYFFRVQILSFLFAVKLFELKVISFFAPRYETLIDWLGVTKVNQVTWTDVVYLSKDVGYALQYPVLFLSFAFAILTYLFHPDSGFNETENMKTLSEKMTPFFPAIQVVQSLDLVNEDVNVGPWSMALTPIEFGKKYKLFSRDPSGKIVVDVLAARVVFSRQLGRLWSGVEDLALHEKGLFAAFLAFTNYDRKSGDALLEQMAGSATMLNVKKGQIDYTGVDELIKKHLSSPIIQSIIKKHGFVHTVLAGLLKSARETGIVQNSLYLWIKPIDRTLWYVLNNTGRRAVFSETAGTYAHFLAEESVGFAIRSPIVDSAVSALQAAADDRIIHDLEDGASA